MRNKHIPFIVLIMMSLFSSCNFNEDKRILVYEIKCDVEPQRGIKHFHDHPNFRDYEIDLKGKISSKEFHSAPSSILMKGKTKYSFNSKVKNVQRGQYYIVSIWRKIEKPKNSKNLRFANLIVEGLPDKIIYLNNSKIVEQGEDGWEKLQIEFEAPLGLESFKVYTFLSNSKEAYFDDFSIKYLQSEDTKQ